MSVASKDLLEESGGFHYKKRDVTTEKLPPNVTTYWLLGKLNKEEQTINLLAPEIKK